ncbi:MAG: CAP domain-containing protein [Leptolyngbyaceae cyanobacterium CRU_2_3]|nr:CAP domain-containing protein [Leptolyngbyaceae cyanobacterium CRU_2_3]
MPHSFAKQVVELTNNYRRQNGLAALTENSKLVAIAQAYSQTMATQDFFAHQGLDGSQPWDRMTAGGYKWFRSAENIAAGQLTPEEVVQGWIDSPGHRANLLDSRVKEIGVGYFFLSNDLGKVNYKTYWTQEFGAPG